VSRPDPRNICDGCHRSLDRRLRLHVELGPIVHKHIWQQISDRDDECLCWECVLRRSVLRLGRMLAWADLRPCRWNLADQPHSWFDLFVEVQGAPPGNLAEWQGVGDLGEFEPLNFPAARGSRP
jgi:hypothetical protein